MTDTLALDYLDDEHALCVRYSYTLSDEPSLVTLWWPIWRGSKQNAECYALGHALMTNRDHSYSYSYDSALPENAKRDRLFDGLDCLCPTAVLQEKDGQAIARAIHACQNSDHVAACCRDSARLSVRGVMLNVADVLAADNPRFDRGRFIEACETGTTRGMRKAS